MREVFRDLAFGLRSLADEPRGTALVAAGGILTGALSLCIWTHIDRVLLGGVEPLRAGGFYVVSVPASKPARAAFWSEPVSTLTGACRGPVVPAASHLDDRSAWLGRLDWSPRATPAPPGGTEREAAGEAAPSPCQLEA